MNNNTIHTNPHAVTSFSAIIFDLDGTLIDTEHLWYASVREFITQQGKVYDESLEPHLLGLAMDDFIRELKSVYSLTSSISELTRGLRRVSNANLSIPPKILPGVPEMLDFVVSNDIPHAIATNSPLHSMEAKLAHYDWGGALEKRFSVDHVRQGKPAPDLYLHTAKQLDIVPSECLVIEDSPNGARGAIAAGMTCYIITNSAYTPREELSSISPHLFGNMHEVLSHIKNHRLIGRYTRLAV